MSEYRVLEVRDVSFKYDKEWVIENVDFSINEGQFLGLVGPNGSGKSTLVKLMLGFLKPDQGTIRVFNQPIKQFNNWKEIGYISQKSNSFNAGFPASVLEVVKSGMVSWLGMFRFLKRKHTEKAMEALKTVEMEEFATSHIGELSGGQQQRVFIARALVSDPSLLILDEPTVGIDEKHVQAFYDLLGRLNQKSGLAILMITHDIDTITEHATKVVCMDKMITFQGESDNTEQSSKQSVSQTTGHTGQQLVTPESMEVRG